MPRRFGSVFTAYRGAGYRVTAVLCARIEEIMSVDNTHYQPSYGVLVSDLCPIRGDKRRNIRVIMFLGVPPSLPL